MCDVRSGMGYQYLPLKERPVKAPSFVFYMAPTSVCPPPLEPTGHQRPSSALLNCSPFSSLSVLG